MTNPGTHITHCCKNCGCKYSDKNCPVVLGHAEQEHKCGKMYACTDGGRHSPHEDTGHQYPDIFRLLEVMGATERRYFFSLLKDKYCIECGFVQPNDYPCQCWRK